VATMTPFLWFDADLAEVVAYYVDAIPSAVVLDRSEGPNTSIHAATLELFGQRVILFNGGPVHAGFSGSCSFMVTVATQEEVDALWTRLTADGGEAGRCGWLKDRYGLSWQIVPDRLGELLGGPDPVRAAQALEAMLTMSKLSIDALQAAYDR
jgi:predicted 3-demethylubiquinone-9 3-methyltransferase (glyoxalase superfamily)